MSARHQPSKGAASRAASDPAEEQSVKIPIEDDSTNNDEAAAPDEAGKAEAPVDEADAAEMTEEEMVEAAIKAGEDAANDDFKAQLDRANEELAELRRANEAAESKASDAADRCARLQADWENYRRRTAAERLAERDRATENLVGSLLPVIDDLERATAHAAGDGAGDMAQFVAGIEAVQKKFADVLAKEGVEVIDPAGDAFDPALHQAVGRVEDASRYDETVNDVYQKGYRMGGHVLRPAMVTVTYGGAKRPAEQPADKKDADK